MTTQHFLQSGAWEKFQKALGRTTFRRQGSGWSYLAIVERSAGLTRLYCPYGPTVETTGSLEAALESLKQEAAAVHAAYLRVQPVGVDLNTTKVGQYKLLPVEYSQPEATQAIDLTRSIDEIYADISQSKRSTCRNYQNKGLVYSTSHDPGDIEKLLPLLHEVAGRNKIAVHTDDYLRTQAQALMPEHASLHFMTLESEIVAAALVFEDEVTNYYAHAGNTLAHRELSASTALVGAIIGYSKDQGKQSFDLYGIAPNDDPGHPWAGVTKFKLSFGGQMVKYNPTFEIALSALPYAAYRVARRLARLKK